MANTKSSDIRLQVLDRCLRRGGYSTDQLIEAVNRELDMRGYPIVTASNTIRKDLDHIAANYPVTIEAVRNGRNITYAYEDRTMSIYKVAMTDDEMVQLTQAISLLSRFKGMPQMEWLQRAMERLRLSVDIEADGKPVVGFDDCVRLQGRQYFGRLLAAVCNKQVLCVEYRKYGDEASKFFTVSPAYLKEHSRRWFLLGMTPGHSKPIVLAFDRIESICEMPEQEFIPADGIDFNDGYFKDVVGVTRFQHEVMDVLLEVSNERLQYFTTKPIHDSQELVSCGQHSSVLRLRVIPNIELVQMLLAYGRSLTVLGPDYLREWISMEIEDMLANYMDEPEEECTSA